MREAWRIEHPEDGKGPYRCGEALGVDELDANITDAHPHHGAIPEDANDRYELLYACDSPEMLGRWFSPFEREACARKGYVVARYRVHPDSYYPGDRQVAFHPARAERVETHPILEVLS